MKNLQVVLVNLCLVGIGIVGLVTSPSLLITILAFVWVFVTPTVFMSLALVFSSKATFEKVANCHLGISMLTVIMFLIFSGTGYGIVPTFIYPEVFSFSGGMLMPYIFGYYAVRNWETYRMYV